MGVNATAREPFRKDYEAAAKKWAEADSHLEFTLLHVFNKLGMKCWRCKGDGKNPRGYQNTKWGVKSVVKCSCCEWNGQKGHKGQCYVLSAHDQKHQPVLDAAKEYIRSKRMSVYGLRANLNFSLNVKQELDFVNEPFDEDLKYKSFWSMRRRLPSTLANRILLGETRTD